MTEITGRPIWIDMGSTDPEGSRRFYAAMFGWDIQVNPDPQFGGYAVAKLGGKDVAGIGPAHDPNAPTAWSVYVATTDIAALGDAVTAAGGSVVLPGMEVGDQGRMAVYQDPSGAFISAWQAGLMGGFQADGPGSFAWAELNARGLDRDLPFYASVFGWTTHASDMPDGTQYIEFQLGGHSIAGGLEMKPMVPDSVPSYWMVYFAVADADASHATALAAGATEMVPPMDFPGGRFSLVMDPQGAAIGLMAMGPR